MTIKAVIFDLDGTITQPYFDFDAIRREIGLARDAGPLLEAMERMSPARRQDAERILHYHEQKALHASTLNPGTTELLATLRQAGIPTAILTRNLRKNALAVLQKHNLHFDAVVGREDGPAKPDAFGVLHICNQLGVLPDQSLLVGDYLFDLQCARAAGALAVWLKNKHHAQDFSTNADFCIDTISDILKIIRPE